MLLEAVTLNDLDAARASIRLGGNARLVDHNSLSLLSRAIINETPDMVRLLLAGGASAASRLGIAVEPIETAVRVDNPAAATEIIIDLLYAGAVVSCDDMCVAARRGNATALWFMSQLTDEMPSGVLFNAINSDCTLTIAMVAALGGTLSIAEQLLVDCWSVPPMMESLQSKRVYEPYQLYRSTKPARDLLLKNPGRVKPYWTSWSHFCWPSGDKLAIKTFYMAMKRRSIFIQTAVLPPELLLQICSFFILTGDGNNRIPNSG